MQQHPGDTIGVIELRNYLIKPGNRDAFIDYFEQHLIRPQIEQQGFPIGQYRIKDNEDNFVWIRGFYNMPARNRFLHAFYYGPAWKQHGQTPNSMLANNDNVYLLKPLTLVNDSLMTGSPIHADQLKTGQGIAVVDLYISNTKLDKLLGLFGRQYLPILKNNGIDHYSLWVSEMQENDFPQLPVFQDKNLLVAITFYKDEQEYQLKQHTIQQQISEPLRSDLLDAITIRHTMVLYPTHYTLTH